MLKIFFIDVEKCLFLKQSFVLLVRRLALHLKPVTTVFAIAILSNFSFRTIH